MFACCAHRSLGFALLSALIAACANASPNETIQAALIEDGRDRLSVQGKPWNPQISVRDAARAKVVRDELAAGRIKEPRDYAAALVLQHGTRPDDFRLANALAWIAFTLNEDKESVPAREASRLYAMSWDRLMLSMNRPQWYLTQRARDPQTHTAGDLLPNDPALALPEDRERFSGPKY